MTQGKMNSTKKKNNKGMALISVIVVIAFVATLASILLLTTLVNFKMKAINTRGKDAFYSAEQVLDEINVYLQQVVSDSMSDAYKYVMKNYADDTSRDKQDKMTLRYYENLWTALEKDGSGHAKYDVTKLEDHLRNSTKWNTGETPGDIDEYGGLLVAIDEAGDPQKEGDMITYTYDGVVLKNLKIYYKDPKGFVSVIQTDIRLGAPDFDFAKSSEVPKISEFSIIGDTKVTMEGLSEVEFDGNLYANQLELIAGRSKGKVTLDGNNKFISKYDIKVKNATLTTESGVEIWSKNIVADSSTVSIDGDVYVENDLNLVGKNTDVTLKGKYFGYGNGAIESKDTNEEKGIFTRFNDANDVSYKSSSIVINGIESKLNLTGLKKLYLAGRAYVGTSGGDITMGESIAIKSDQMMYLVPPSAIGVVKIGEKYASKYDKNPLTLKEVNDLKTLMEVDTKEELVSYDMEIPEMGNHKLMVYMTNPLKDASGKLIYDEDGELQYETRKISCKTVTIPVNKGVSSDDDLVYFYMDFNSEANANMYYEDYYANNKERTDKFLDYYGDSIKLPLASASSKTAGDYPYLVGKDEKGKKNYSTVGGISSESSEENAESYKRYVDMFNSLTRHLVSYRGGDNNRANSFDEDKEDLRVVYNGLIVPENNRYAITDPSKKTQLEELALMGTNESGDTYTFVNENVYDGRVVEVTAKTTDAGSTWIFSTPSDGDIAYISTNVTDVVNITNSDNYKLVITAGKANVKRDFEGLLIAHKDIDISSNVKTISSDKERVDEIMKFEIGNAYYYVANVLKDGENYSSGENASFSLRDYIVYENWKKE